jgi:pimeloyl-ACP methyl ester carboxylesterase
VHGTAEPALVFLHYWGGTSRTWRQVTAELEGQFKTVAYDARGWGKSDKTLAGYKLADLADEALSLDVIIPWGQDSGRSSPRGPQVGFWKVSPIGNDKRATVERKRPIPRSRQFRKLGAGREHRCEITGVKFQAGLLSH